MQKFLFFIATIAPQIIFAQSQSTNSSTAELKAPGITKPKPYMLRAIFLTSRAGRKLDYRNARPADSDDRPEAMTLPDLNYLTAIGGYKFSESTLWTLATVQSLDSEESRSLSTPFGKKIVLPGQIYSSAFKYTSPSGYFGEVRQSYSNVFFLSDPMIGGGIAKSESSFSHRASLHLAVPTTEKSRADKQITRASAKAGLVIFKNRWMFMPDLAFSKSFFSSSDAKSQASGPAPTSPTGKPGESPTGKSGDSSSTPVITPRFTPDQLDLILADRQDTRTSISLNSAYSLSDRWSYLTGASISRINKLGGGIIWSTSFKPAGVNYRLQSWEFASDLNMYSDIARYETPSIPTQWNIGARVSYLFGSDLRN